jgi:thiosulfate/3-mercaptopyruvate sulfurtransferase
MTLFKSSFAGMCIMTLLALLMLANVAFGGEAYCDACKSDSDWSGEKALDQIGNSNATSTEVMPGLSTAQKNRVGIWNKPLSGLEENSTAGQDSSAEKSAEQSNANAARNSNASNDAASVTETAAKPIAPAEENATIVRSARAKMMLIALDELSSDDVLLDISENATDHIPGSIAIPYEEFMINGSEVKAPEEIASILGNAGISNDDSVVIYGECMPCGGGPVPSDFVYWIMRSLGHEKVRVLDGTVEDWVQAGKPTSTETAIRSPESYKMNATSQFSADYDSVKEGQLQIVDARTVKEFGEGSIPGAINIPDESVVVDSRLKNETKLERIFAILDRNQPVAVYTNTGLKASVVWFALELLGYDAKLYSYKDWQSNRKAVGDSAS